MQYYIIIFIMKIDDQRHGRVSDARRTRLSTFEGHRVVIRELLSGRFKSVSEVGLLHENVILSD